MGRFSGFKNLQILALGKKNLASRGPTALGRTKFFALGLIFEAFSTLGMKKFPYLKTGPFGNPIFRLIGSHSNFLFTFGIIKNVKIA